MQARVKKLDSSALDQFIVLLGVYEIAFEIENFCLPSSEHLQSVLGTPDCHVFVALEGEKVVGGITGYALKQYYSEKSQFYIYDLAVLPDRQRKGIGRQLIAEVNKYFKKKGFEQSYVQADKDDDHAVAFYRNSNITDEADVFHFSYLL